MAKGNFSLRSDLEKARASALASLSLREHSIKELTDKLTQKGYEEISIRKVIEECIGYNYLNNERFAEIFWRNRSAKGFGPNKIRIELKLKGIDSQLIQSSSQQKEIDFEKVVKSVYFKKYKGIQIVDFKDKLKRQNYLYQRGFDRDLIDLVIDE
jgi:regulatory protein